MAKIKIQKSEITVVRENNEDFISLTDIEAFPLTKLFSDFLF
jgi:hypothetical protein